MTRLPLRRREGIPYHDGHHATSHHQNKPDKIDKLVKIQHYHIGLFARFLDKLKNTPDGDGSLLDHSVLLYGSNMSNSNVHNHFPLPNLLVGGGCGTLKGGRHLRYEDHTPMTNLLVLLSSLLSRLPVQEAKDTLCFRVKSCILDLFGGVL